LTRPLFGQTGKGLLFVFYRYFSSFEKIKIMLSDIQISKRPFWDIDLAKLNTQKDALFIIQRVLEYGVWGELKAITQFYGKTMIAEAVKQAPYLTNKTFHFCCLWLNLKPEECKCYIKKQSNQEHWNY
jgi:hypothetical protein